ncbi:hypothetical protein FXO37_17592 [Capsicum annuum]|nr:hypothetical protein FXO37_17592 [Capsicum annuum]
MLLVNLIIAVALAINQVNAEKECTEILHPNPGSIFGCVLRDCNKECKEKHNGTGYCTSDAGIESSITLSYLFYGLVRLAEILLDVALPMPVADVNCKLERNDNGSYIVRISATPTLVVAELRRLLELLMRGKIVQHVDITPTVVKFLFSREGINIMRTVHGETRAYIHLDKHSLHIKIFSSLDNVDRAEQRFIDSLLALHESKQLEVHLRGGLLPPDLMKRVVIPFGPDLSMVKEKVPGAEFSLKQSAIASVSMVLKI